MWDVMASAPTAGFLSTITVFRSARAVYSAHVQPAGPPPTMTTSHSTSSIIFNATPRPLNIAPFRRPAPHACCKDLRPAPAPVNCRPSESSPRGRTKLPEPSPTKEFAAGTTKTSKTANQPSSDATLFAPSGRMVFRACAPRKAPTSNCPRGISMPVAGCRVRELFTLAKGERKIGRFSL